MTYNIWKDPLFYFYVAIFSVSAIVFVNSVCRLFSHSNSSENGKEVLNDDEEELLEDDVDIGETEPVVIEENGRVNINKNDDEIEKIEISKPSETLFKNNTLKEEEEPVAQKMSPAEEYLLKLNTNLDDIKKKLSHIESAGSISTIEKRILNLENKINELSKNDKLLNKISDLELMIKTNQVVKNNARSEEEKIQTPKYIHKYISDIVDDYENIDKEMIRKRLMLILNELEKLNDQDGE